MTSLDCSTSTLQTNEIACQALRDLLTYQAKIAHKFGESYGDDKDNVTHDDLLELAHSLDNEIDTFSALVDNTLDVYEGKNNAGCEDELNVFVVALNALDDMCDLDTIDEISFSCLLDAFLETDNAILHSHKINRLGIDACRAAWMLPVTCKDINDDSLSLTKKTKVANSEKETNLPGQIETTVTTSNKCRLSSLQDNETVKMISWKARRALCRTYRRLYPKMKLADTAAEKSIQLLTAMALVVPKQEAWIHYCSVRQKQAKIHRLTDSGEVLEVLNTVCYDVLEQLKLELPYISFAFNDIATFDVLLCELYVDIVLRTVHEKVLSHFQQSDIVYQLVLAIRRLLDDILVVCQNYLPIHPSPPLRSISSICKNAKKLNSSIRTTLICTFDESLNSENKILFENGRLPHSKVDASILPCLSSECSPRISLVCLTLWQSLSRVTPFFEIPEANDVRYIIIDSLQQCVRQYCVEVKKRIALVFTSACIDNLYLCLSSCSFLKAVVSDVQSRLGHSLHRNLSEFLLLSDSMFAQLDDIICLCTQRIIDVNVTLATSCLFPCLEENKWSFEREREFSVVESGWAFRSWNLHLAGILSDLSRLCAPIAKMFILTNILWQESLALLSWIRHTNASRCRTRQLKKDSVTIIAILRSYTRYLHSLSDDIGTSSGPSLSILTQLERIAAEMLVNLGFLCAPFQELIAALSYSSNNMELHDDDVWEQHSGENVLQNLQRIEIAVGDLWRTEQANIQTFVQPWKSIITLGSNLLLNDVEITSNIDYASLLREAPHWMSRNAIRRSCKRRSDLRENDYPVLTSEQIKARSSILHALQNL